MISATNNQNEYHVSPGTYLLCDPAGVVSGQAWADFTQDLSLRDPHLGILEDGSQFLAFPVECGELRDQYGNTFPVRSGFVGLLPASAIPENALVRGRPVTFVATAHCGYDEENASYHFNHITLSA